MVSTNNCCGCFTLRTGCLIIGALEVLCFLVVARHGMDLFRFERDIVRNKNLFRNNQDLIDGIRYVEWTMIITYSAEVLLGIVLLNGVLKKKASLLPPFIVLRSLLAVLKILALTIIYCIWLKLTFITSMFFILPIVITLYFMIVIYSYYKELKSPTTSSNPAASVT